MENPIVDLSKLSEPLTKLVDVISAGIGNVYAPFGTIRQAKADAKAKIIHADADMQVASIYQRAQGRHEYREALRQENIEKIACQAALELPGSVSKEQVGKDWILQFFDYAQDVCEEDIQVLWARVLAGEVASPGSYCKRTLQFLRTMEKWEAEHFTTFCSYSFTLEGGEFIFQDPVTRRYLSKSGDFNFYQHFNDIGLINTESLITPSRVNGMVVKYHGKSLQFRSLIEEDGKSPLKKLELPFSYRAFSIVGQELSKISGAKAVDGYLSDLTAYFTSEVKVAIEEIS